MSTSVDATLQGIFGVDAAGLEQATAVRGPLPEAYFGRLLHLIDGSGAVEMLTRWDQEARKSNAGRKAHVNYRAVMIAFLLNTIWGTGYSYQELAHTIAYRLSVRQRDELGITGTGRFAKDWYHASHRGTKRLLKLIDPWHLSGLRTRKTGAEHDRALANYDVEREERSHELAAALVAASVRLLPERFREEYSGDVALDSTFLRVRGLSNPGKKRERQAGLPTRDRLNVDDQCGWYTRRSENHDGSMSANSEPGYELDTVVMVDAHQGKYAFPLITGIGFHRPGELKKWPRFAMDQHAAFTDKRGLVLVDRAFNNLNPIDFQEPVRRHRFETVYDYRHNQLGRQGSVPGKPVILIDGALYVDRMPDTYVMITRWHADGKINPVTGEPYTVEERDEVLRLREAYRMKPHGKIDADGNQRFSYPNPSGYLSYDPVTQQLADKPAGTVMVGLSKDTIKHLQKYPWQSEKGRAVYGQRNQVETSNKNLKGHRWANLGDAEARTGRGHAYTFFTAMIATVAENLRRIVTGIRAVLDEAQVPVVRQVRARRRRDSVGERLTHPTGERPRDGRSVPGADPDRE